MGASFNRHGTADRTVTLTGEGLPELLGRSALTVVRVEGQENLCELFEYRVTLKTPDSLNTAFGPAANLDMPALQGRELTIALELDGRGSGLVGRAGAGKREISGLVTKVEGPVNDGRSLAYTLTLRPWLYLATKTSDLKIFQQKTVVEILHELLADYHFPVEMRLDVRRYPKREYQVQYGETDYAFFQRLTEEWGIAFFFEHSEEKHRLVLTDGNGAFRRSRSPAYHYVRWHGSAARIDEEHIQEFAVTDRLVSGAWTSNDFDFNKPRAELGVGTRDPRETAHADGQVHEWPGDHAQPVTCNDPWKEGDMLSRIRMEELRQVGSRASGKGNLRGLAAGCIFALTHHPRKQANVEYLIYATRLQLEEVAEEAGQDQHWQCEVGFEVQPATVIFRPARLLKKPRTSGPQTATVVGPRDQEAWLDEFGRIRIQLHWDRIGRSDENSSCWVRVSQTWQGDQFGASHIPRIGQEVIVDFLNGDPDCPIVTGRIPNRVNMPQWLLPSQHALSGIRSKELFGERHNTFLQDDTQGQIQTQIGSDHQTSLLSLGYITRVHDAEGRKEKRGEGFELRTDGHGAIRSAKGMLVSTELRHEAQGHHKDMGEVVQRLANGRDVQAILGESADCQRAQDSEQSGVAKLLKAQIDGIRGNGELGELSEPHLVAAGPAAIAATTAESTHLHSGQHTAISTGAHVSFATGGGIFGSFAERAVLFVQKLGMRFFAAKGKVEIQAQSDDIEIIAQKVLKLVSLTDLIEVAAKKEILLNGGGSYIRIHRNGIEQGTPGNWKAFSAVPTLPGAKTEFYPMPGFTSCASEVSDAMSIGAGSLSR